MLEPEPVESVHLHRSPGVPGTKLGTLFLRELLVYWALERHGSLAPMHTRLVPCRRGARLFRGITPTTLRT